MVWIFLDQISGFWIENVHKVCTISPLKRHLLALGTDLAVFFLLVPIWSISWTVYMFGLGCIFNYNWLVKRLRLTCGNFLCFIVASVWLRLVIWRNSLVCIFECIGLIDFDRLDLFWWCLGSRCSIWGNLLRWRCIFLKCSICLVFLNNRCRWCRWIIVIRCICSICRIFFRFIYYIFLRLLWLLLRLW